MLKGERMPKTVVSGSESTSTSTSVLIPCGDGYCLHATLRGAGAPLSGVVLIHPATAVPESLYAAFADYLVSRGFAVVTYDYRGIGRSRPKSLRGFKASMRDWADLDVEAVTRWARNRFPDQRLLAVGHSFGGHAIGLCESSRHLDAAVFVASHAGCLRFIRGRTERIRVTALLKAIGPLLCKLTGFMPGKALKLGEDLPRGVMHDWSTWTSMERYFFDDPSMDAQTRFARPKMPVLALGFDDDPWATPQGIDLLVGQLTGCNIERRQVAPAQAGSPIGHMGFFRRKHLHKLWPDVATWLQSTEDRAKQPII